MLSTSGLYIGPPALIAVFMLDLLLGDPKGFPHPVVLMGRVIGYTNRLLNRSSFASMTKRISGVIVALILPISVLFVTVLTIETAYYLNQTAGILTSIFLAYTTLSARGLKDVASKIKGALKSGDIDGGRMALSCIVGRDTGELGTPEIIRATVESVSENSSDGVIAPLFYLMIGGVPLAMVYKAINTLDSMIGYKDERYLDFGWASAKLDDLANFIPARLTSFLMVISSVLLGLNWRRSLQVIQRDGRNHPSPNAGYAEAAAAGAIGIRLGGKNSYAGVVEERPYIGDSIKELEIDDIDMVIRLMYLSSIIMIVIYIGIRRLVG